MNDWLPMDRLQAAGAPTGAWCSSSQVDTAQAFGNAIANIKELVAQVDASEMSVDDAELYNTLALRCLNCGLWHLGGGRLDLALQVIHEAAQATGDAEGVSAEDEKLEDAFKAMELAFKEEMGIVDEGEAPAEAAEA